MDYTKQIDYSSLSTYLDCPRKFFFQYMLHLRSPTPNLDLIFGGSWHYGLEQAYRAWSDNKSLSKEELRDISINAFNLYWKVLGEPHWPDPDLIFPKSPGHAANMYSEYWDHYYEEDSTKQILGVEIPFRIKLIPELPEYIGRIDLALMRDIQLQIIDHKTTKYVTKATLPSFQSSLQTDGYLTAGKIYFDKLPIMTYNIAICQKSKIAFERMDIMKRDLTTDRFLAELLEFMTNVQLDIKLMHFELEEPEAREKAYLPQAFNRNPGYACTQYFRKCSYFDICMLRNNAYLYIDTTPQGYTVDEWDPTVHEAKTQALIDQAR